MLSKPGIEDDDVVARFKQLGIFVRLPLKTVDVVAHEAGVLLVQRYGIQISLLADDAIVSLAQVAFLRGIEYLAAGYAPLDAPSAQDFADGARIGRSRDWTAQFSKTKVSASSGTTWIAEEVLGRCAICHCGELLNDPDESGEVDVYGPMQLEDEKARSLFYGSEIPDASFLGERWAMKMIEAATMIKALPVAPEPPKKKRTVDDETLENTEKRIFSLVKVVDQDLIPRFVVDSRKRVQSASHDRQSQARMSVDVRHSIRASFVPDKENHNLPPKNGHFQDRSVCLLEIRKHLSTSGRVVITGPHGVGKSQAALYFAHTALAVRKYHLIYRIECQTVTQVELGYRALAEFFKMDISNIGLTQIIHKVADRCLPQTRSRDSMHTYAQVHMRLSNDPALFDFLLIYDDVPSEDKLLAFIPSGFPERKGKYDSHIILTSVGTSWSRTSAIALGGYTESECSVHLFRQLPSTTKPDREALAAALKYHPLSVAQAIGFIKHSNTSITEYLQTFQSLLKPSRDDRDQYAALSRATSTMVFGELEKRAAVAASIADHASFLSPASIQEEIVMAVLRSKGADQMLDPGVLLCETMALITRVGNEGSASFQMHDVVRESRSASMPASDAEAIMSTWMSILSVVYDRSQPTTKDLLKQRELLLPHAEYILQHWQNMHDKPDPASPPEQQEEWLSMATTLLNVAHTCQDLCIFDQAQLFSETALRVRRALQGDKHESIAEVLEMQAAIARSQGKLDRAVELYEEVYSMLSAANGSDSVGLAVAVQGLGDVYMKQGEAKKAQSGYETALKLRTKAFGSRHELVAESMEGLAKVLVAQGGSPLKAVSLMEEVLNIRKSVLGNEHPAVADALIGLASLNDNMADIGQALERYDQAIRIYELHYPKDHYKIFSASLAVADIYQQSDPDRALRYLEVLYKLRRTVYGLGHADVALVLRRIAALFEIIGDATQALTKYEEALDSYSLQRVSAHTGIADTMSCAANIKRARGDFQGALEMFEECLALRKKLFGDLHPDVALTYNNIAVVYDSQGNYDRALALYEDALRIYRALLPKNHPDIATTIHNMASLYDAKGEFKKAVSMYDEALRMRKSALGKTHPDVAATLNNMAGMYESQKEYSKALKLYEEALKIRKESLGAEHPDVASTLNNMAGVYAAQKKTTKAISYYEDSLRIRRAAYGDDNPEVATTLTNLGLVFDAKGDVHKALQMYEESLAIFRRKLGPDHQYTIQTEKLILGVQADM